MKTDYRDFDYFDFHDSYFEKVDKKADSLIWYLSAVNVSPECTLNPKSCSMMASEMRIEFVDCKVEPRELDVKKLAKDNFEILEVKRISEDDSSYTYLFCVISRRDYMELELTFTNVLFEWEKYEAKAWYVYTEEKEAVKDFLDKNPQIAWMCLNNEQGGKIVEEFHRELHQSHALYCIEAMALAKSESRDEVLLSMDNGTCVIVHLTYAKEIAGEFPRFFAFDTVEQALEHIAAEPF